MRRSTARVVDEDIEPPVLGGNAVEAGIDGGGVTDVTGNEFRFAPPRHWQTVGRPPAASDHRGSGRQKRFGNALADALGTPGDNHHAAGKFEARRHFLSLA